MQIKDFSIPKYDDPVHWINKQIEHNIDWGEIRLGRQKDEEALKNFLKKKKKRIIGKLIQLKSGINL